MGTAAAAVAAETAAAAVETAAATATAAATIPAAEQGLWRDALRPAFAVPQRDRHSFTIEATSRWMSSGVRGAPPSAQFTTAQPWARAISPAHARQRRRYSPSCSWISAANQLMRRREAETNTAADIHEQDGDYLRRCRECAGEIARTQGWAVVNCAGDGVPRTPEDIHREVLAIVLDCLSR